MTETKPGTEAATRAAMLCAAAVIAQQVGAKATRDAIFLSSFGVRELPTILVVSALVSIVFVFAASRVMAALGPGRLVPAAFGASGALLLVEWVLLRQAPPVAAVAVYLHVAAFGSILISGFWSLVNERFDPRAAKRRIGRIAGAGTLGGLLGGLAAERVAALSGVASMLPLLALLHFACAFWVRSLRPVPPPDRGPGEATTAARPPEPAPAAFRLVRDDPFLRSLAFLVVAGSASAALVDYVFKSQAVASYGGGAPLLRFFAVFYTATGLLAFAIQVSLGRLSLERLGLARTVATLPLAVVAGAFGSLVSPGLSSAGGMRGAESVLRGSLYRLGYELLYAPLPPAQKRATKTLLDVGLDRLGDVLGAGFVRAVLLAFPQGAPAVLGGAIMAVGLLSLWVARSLDRGYVQALKKSLLSRAEAMGVAGVPAPILGAADPLDTGLFLLTVGMELPAEVRPLTPESPRPAPAGPPVALEPLVERLLDLRSGDRARVSRALTGLLDPMLVPQVISLLAWDEVCGDAIRALQGVAPKASGQLADSLLDPAEEFSIRRRIPRVLAEARSQRAAEALMRGLEDKRFEVRFECGRALARMLARDPDLVVSKEDVFTAVGREAATDKTVWESRRLLESPEEAGEGSLVDEFLRDRSSRSLEHVFTVLSLALPREPLKVAFRGLHTDDEALRGTALEYLESVLPARVRESLWPFLEDERPLRGPRRSAAEVLEELMRSHSSIEVNLVALRNKMKGGPGA